MTFSSARIVSNFNYYINGEILIWSMRPIKDLGILFYFKLKLDCYINITVNRWHKIIGFINQNCADFIDKYALKSIYCSLVRFICECRDRLYGLNSHSGHKSKLEKI